MAGSQTYLGDFLREVIERLQTVPVWGPHTVDESDPMTERTVQWVKAEPNKRHTSVTLEDDINDDYENGAGNCAEQVYKFLIVHTRVTPTAGSLLLDHKEPWINLAADALTNEAGMFTTAGETGYAPIVTGRNYDDRGIKVSGISEVSFIFEVRYQSPHHDQ